MTQLLERPVDVIDVDHDGTGESGGSKWHPVTRIVVISLPALAALAGFIVVMAIAGHWSAPPPQDRVLVTDQAQRVSLIDLESGTPVYEVEDAVAAPDGSRVYRVRPFGADTALEELDADTGTVVATQVVEGPLRIRVVSPSGGAVALMPGDDPGRGLYVPEPKDTTTITVAQGDGAEPRRYELAGNFEPETFSLDEDTLFLIEFWPPTEPDRYFVRHLDLQTGEIRDEYTPEIELAPEMRGKARAQVMDPDGEFLYTLYSMEPGADPIHDPAAIADSERWAFVHVLDLREERSICIFLPEPFGTGSLTAIGLGISPDGETLFVVDAATDRVARIDTGTHLVTEVGVMEKLWVDELNTRPSVAVVDGERFFVTTGWSILEVDATDGFVPVDALGLGERVIDLDLSPDGRELRIGTETRIVVYDIEDESEVALTLTGLGGDGSAISFVGNASGVVGRIPLECAC